MEGRKRPLINTRMSRNDLDQYYRGRETLIKHMKDGEDSRAARVRQYDLDQIEYIDRCNKGHVDFICRRKRIMRHE